jgi:hypothetical protein
MSARRAKPLVIAAFALASAMSAATLLWHAPHCRAFVPHQHYSAAPAAMCARGAP